MNLVGARGWEVVRGDSLGALGVLVSDESFDAMVTDPPAGIEFMGKEWDRDHGGRDGWIRAFAATFRECLRVLKPGAHALVWALPRTSHWTATALEDAGFEVRDVVTHHFGTGFPKSLNLGKNPSFCLCDARSDGASRSDADIGRGRGEGDHTSTDLPSALPSKGARVPNAHRGKRTPGGSQAGCQSDCGSDGARLLRDEVGDQASSRPLAGVLGRSRSPARGDGPEGFARTSSPSIGSDPPSIRDSGDPSGAGLGSESSRNSVSRETGSETGSRRSHSSSRGESLSSAFSDCTTCEKPIATGFGTALKPATEHWILARRPLGGTVARCVLEHGTGAINVDGCRVGEGQDKGVYPITQRRYDDVAYTLQPVETDITKGRWPANLLFSHAAACVEGADGGDGGGACSPGCPVAALDGQSGLTTTAKPREGGFRPDDAEKGVVDFKSGSRATYPVVRGDSGGVSRFFPTFRYQAKASTRERNAGLPEGVKSKHPTVKPVDLMRWLCRLVTPPGGLVLDPFAGSGSTGVAALAEGFRFVGIEREAGYVEVARARLEHAVEAAKGESS